MEVILWHFSLLLSTFCRPLWSPWAAVCVWGGINLLEGYGQDNPGSKSQGVKQLVAGGGVALIGITLVPLLSGLLATP